MKTLPVDFTGYGPVGKPAMVVRITRRDGEIIRIAQAQSPITVVDTSETFSPVAGVVLHAMKHTRNGDMPSTQIDAVMTSAGTFRIYDVIFKKYDGAKVEIYVVDRTDLATAGLLFTGFIGAVTYSPLATAGPVSFEVRGQATRATLPFTQVYGPMCRTDLGSTLCKIPILPDDVARQETIAVGDFRRVRFTANDTPDDYANRYLEATAITTGVTAASAPSFSSTIGNTTVDGGVTWTTRDAWTRYAKVATIVNAHSITLDAVPDARAVDGWYDQGAMIFRTGFSAGRGYEVGSWTNSSKTVATYLPIGEVIAVDDWLEIYPGCFKRRVEDCFTKFANTANFQGEDGLAGVAAAAAGS